jgi:5-methylcytosine-specific restriction enzyme A
MTGSKTPRLTNLRPRVTMASPRITVRPKRIEPAYHTKEWRALVIAIIRQRGRRCEDPQCTTQDRGAGRQIYGDHIRELQDGGALLDPGNVLLRCASCHTRKTLAERTKRMAKRW